MASNTVTPKQVTEALKARADTARHLDNARRELIEAAKSADRSDLRGTHLDIAGSVSALDRARMGLVGEDD